VSYESSSIKFDAQADYVGFSTSFTIAKEKTLMIWLKSDRPLSTQDN